MKRFFTITLCALVSLGYSAAHATEIPAAYHVTDAELSAAASMALVEKGIGQRVRATVMGVGSAPVYASAHPLVVKVTGVNADKNTRRFTGNALILSGSETVTALPISGRYEEMVLLPVVKRQIRSGETIAQADIDTMEFPMSRTRSDMVTDEKQLVGQTPRATISQKRPIRATEIAQPAVIRKNTTVEMRFQRGGMQISTTGQALDNGASGDMIAVRNLTSKTIVRAQVLDAHTVLIGGTMKPRELAHDESEAPHAISN